MYSSFINRSDTRQKPAPNGAVFYLVFGTSFWYKFLERVSPHNCYLSKYAVSYFICNDHNVAIRTVMISVSS